MDAHETTVERIEREARRHARRYALPIIVATIGLVAAAAVVANALGVAS